MKAPTQRQVEVASLIYEGYVKLRDIAAVLGISHKGVSDHIHALERKGLLSTPLCGGYRPSGALNLTHYGLYVIGVPVCPVYHQDSKGKQLTRETITMEDLDALTV